MRRILPTIAVAVMVSVMAPMICAQMEKTLRFIPESLDFGIIREEDGKQSRSVRAINISDSSTCIISARTSCGCSVAEYPEQILAPGDTTEITITYDPFNRPGQFLKTAKIFTGEERIGNSFKIKGTVVPSRKNLLRAYPDSVGVLRLSSRIIDAGSVSPKEVRPLFVGIYNDSNRPLRLSASSDASPLEAAIAPDSLESFSTGTLTLMLKGRLIPDDVSVINYYSFIIDASSGDTIVTIPVGGFVDRILTSPK